MTTTMAVQQGNAEDQQTLIDDATRGEQDALATLYTTHFDQVYAYLRLALNDPEAAEEAAQRVFLTAFQALPDSASEADSFSRRLLEIAHDLVVELLGKGSDRPIDRSRAFHRDFAGSGEETLRALRWTSDEDLLLLLDRLPEVQRQAVVLEYVLGFDRAEIGKILRKTPQGVEQLQSDALAFLEERLAAVGREPSSGGRLAMRRFRGRSGPLRAARGITSLRYASRN